MDDELKNMVDRVVDDVKYLNEDTEFVKFMSDEDEERLYINTIREEGKALGIKEGKAEGKKKYFRYSAQFIKRKC